MENQLSYRIRTDLGSEKPISIPVSLMQEYNSFEILSLKMNMDDTYRSYTSTEGIVVGRVSTANNGLGIPNVRVSIFVSKNAYDQSDEEAVLYPFSSPTDTDNDRVRYNLLPSDSDVNCYQVIGTLPTKRKILDNETVCEVFDKYFKYTTITNEAGDFMLSNIPVGKQRLHIDADLSDIGPFLSQHPYDMIENLGFNANQFESTRQFKTSKDLDSLAQVLTQNKSVYVYPYWGDSTENNAEMKITRTDLSLNYEFKTSAVFIGSIITDKGENSIRVNCTPTETAGKMSDMITGPGRIEMIRKTVDNSVEQYRIKGDMLINDNGVWCYSIPMNLDFVRTDEYGRIIPTDDPDKGVPTRARVRFRITLDEMDSDEDAHKRCSYLVPNNPKITDVNFLKEDDADYSFGSDTWEESFVDLFWNKVYTVKNFIPQMQKSKKFSNRKHTGIKLISHYGDNNPFPYNRISIKLSFSFKLLCIITKVFIALIKTLNGIISIIGALPCYLMKLFKGLSKAWPIGWAFSPAAKAMEKIIPGCISLDSEFCDDGINSNIYYPGCVLCVWTDKTRPECQKEQQKLAQQGEQDANCTHDDNELANCVETQLAQESDSISFNFANDWVNGVLYAPLWYRYIKPKKSFFFGLFKRKAKDQWCAGNKSVYGNVDLKMMSFCAHKNSGIKTGQNYAGETVEYHYPYSSDGCGSDCHNQMAWAELESGVIINVENMLGQTVWYYKATEVGRSNDDLATEYQNMSGVSMVSKTLFATDIVLLGSMNDCDLNGVPKFYDYLTGTTYNKPTDLLFTDTEISYTFDEDTGEVINAERDQISVSSGCDWGNKNEWNYKDGGLFYSIGCTNAKTEVDTPGCINLRRICELGVGLDEMDYIDDISKGINDDTEELDHNNSENYLRPDGFISYDDIADFNYRSMFATMNGNYLKTKINTETSMREYDFHHLYIDNFDGALQEFMQKEQTSRDPIANYRYNYKLETTNVDYFTFRMGPNPYYYDGKNLIDDGSNQPQKFILPKYENSFYFYFGLKEGKTAIDLFNEQYNGPCATPFTYEDVIPYTYSANSWCCLDSDDMNSYDHLTYDGYLAIDFSDLALPCTAVINSKSNSGVTYTVYTLDEDGEKQYEITDDKICFYGYNAETDEEEGERVSGISEDTQSDLSSEGYTQYLLEYENTAYTFTPFDGEGVSPCYMLNNGEYTMNVTDGDGNKYSYNIKIDATYLEYSHEERSFASDNRVLLETYLPKTSTQENADAYDLIARSPSTPTSGTPSVIDIGIEDSIPIVTRTDGTKDDSPKLNGTICLYYLFNGDDDLTEFIVEVECADSSDDDLKDYHPISFNYGSTYKNRVGQFGYLTSDTVDATSVNNTQYEAGVMIDSDTYGRLSEEDQGKCSKVVYYDNAISQYFYRTDVNFSQEDETADPSYRDCVVIKCPKGGVYYNVTVTQLCDGGVDATGRQYYKLSQNYVKNKIFVDEPTKYQLLINDVDYDIIKNFKTGWELSASKKMQDTGRTGTDPFKAVGNINNIVGWLEISNMFANYAWEENEKAYGNTSYDDYLKIYTKSQTGINYTNTINFSNFNGLGLDLALTNDDEGKYVYEIMLDKIGDELPEEISEAGLNEWEKLMECEDILSNRLDFIQSMKDAFWIQTEDGTSVTYDVRTDDTPYDIWTVYNAELELETTENTQTLTVYHELESQDKKKNSGKREKWTTTGDEGTESIDDVLIPNITSVDSVTYGMADDDTRRDKYTTSYNSNICFAQDNMAASGGINIKPPYIVACVNNAGRTKPANLTEGSFFAKGKNDAGVETYMFKYSSKRYVSDGTNEFFQFYLIDKIFSTDVICWSYILDVPYYLPNSDDTNRVGKLINTNGLVAGFVRNGVSNSVDAAGYIDDFTESTVFDKDVNLKTYNSDTEDSIPTHRCIIYKGDSKWELSYTEGENSYTTISDDDAEYCTGPYKTIANISLSFSTGDYVSACVYEGITSAGGSLSAQRVYLVVSGFDNYNVNDEIDENTYDKLPDDDKENCDEYYKVIGNNTVTISSGITIKECLYDYLSDDDKANCAAQYRVTEGFTQTFSIGDILTSEGYNSLSVSNKADYCVYASYIVKAGSGSFETGSTTYSEGDIIEGNVYYDLTDKEKNYCSERYKITNTFSVSYTADDIIPSCVYDIIGSQQGNCEYYYGTVTEAFHITFYEGTTISSETYNKLSGSNQSYCDGDDDTGYVVMKQFTADYQVGDIITEDEYNLIYGEGTTANSGLSTISDDAPSDPDVDNTPPDEGKHKDDEENDENLENQDKCSIYYRVTSNVNITFSNGDYVTSCVYDYVPDDYKPNCEEGYYYVDEAFTTESLPYNEGDVIDGIVYSGMDSATQAKFEKNSDDYVVIKPFSVEYKTNDIITEDIYNSLSDENKALCVLYYIVTTSFTQIITNDEYLELTDTQKANCTQSLVYRSYRYLTENNISEANQFAYSYNSESDLTFFDNSNNMTERALYGKMRLSVDDSTIAEPSGKWTFTLNLSNYDTDGDDATIYWYNASNVSYPLNAFNIATDGTFYMDSYGSTASWDGSETKATQLFNKNTTLSHLSEKIMDSKSLMITEKDEDGNETTVVSGTSSWTVTNNDSQVFAIVAIENSKGGVLSSRTISPVYDFTAITCDVTIECTITKNDGSEITDDESEEIIYTAYNATLDSIRLTKIAPADGLYYLEHYAYTIEFETVDSSSETVSSEYDVESGTPVGNVSVTANDLTDEFINALNDVLSDSIVYYFNNIPYKVDGDKVKKKINIYITDITGLKHRCIVNLTCDTK